MRLRERKKRAGALLRAESGQSTVEYAVILGVFMVVVMGLGALVQVMGEGLFVEHALAAASHHLQATTAGVIDVFVY